MTRQIVLLWALVLVGGCKVTGQSKPQTVAPPVAAKVQKVGPSRAEQMAHWTDSLMKVLSPRERLAQLFMVAAYSNRDKAHLDLLDSLVFRHRIGGLIWFQGGPLRQANMNNNLGTRARVPILSAMDAEWGLGMRLDSTLSYPKQMALGALRDPQQIEMMGAEIARQSKLLNMHMNFAPVVDVNSNAANPVIGSRAFSEDRNDVVIRSLLYMNGLQNNGVMACAKHFPGHGDTDTDSHLDLPLLNHNRARLDSMELYPFKKLIEKGIKSVMVAHMNIPALDTTKNLASTLSRNIVTDLLKHDLGFEGLVFTDALNMKGVSKYYKPGEVEVKAFLAGNDVMLFAEDVPKALDSIMLAVDSGWVSQTDIDARCRKVLMAKAWAGLDRYKPIDTKHLYEQLNTPEAKGLREALFAQSITVAINKNNAIPLVNSALDSVASVVIGGTQGNVFQEMLARYWPMRHHQLPMAAKQAEVDTLALHLAKAQTVIISLHGTNSKRDKNYGLTEPIIALIDTLAARQKVVLNVFGIPYVAGSLRGLDNVAALVFANELNTTTEGYAAQAIMGGIGVNGRLPVTVSATLKRGAGVDTKATRLGYGTPFQQGMDARTLAKVDALLDETVNTKCAPGGQLLVVRHGMVVYEKTFGNHMYDSARPVKPTDLYDLASVTKITSTLPAFMQLVDEGKVKLDHKLEQHLPRLKGTNKANITFREMLAHYAKLQPWIPFYRKTLTNNVIDGRYYRTMPSDAFNVQVAEELYIRSDYPDSIRATIDASELLGEQAYKYSDLAYYYLRDVVERYRGHRLDSVTAQSFYAPMGLQSMAYLPLARTSLDRIVPTEYDNTFRNQLIHGHVHDQGAAMLGGIGGHAGLFAHARDVAAMMQMYLNNGTYGGKRYVSEATIKEFSRCQYCDKGNRRAVGFDRPAKGGEGPTCECVSLNSFGHTGFTGTMAWADPEQGIVYIFLSNRVYPDADNNKLVKQNIRTRIQQVVYDSITEQD